MKTMPDFTIAILTWNRADFLEKCLQSLFAAMSPDITHEVLVLDNGSTDGTPGVLARFADRPGFRVLRNRTNEGIHGYKRLFRAARGRYILELDDDVLRLPAGFDRIFLDYFAAYPDYGYVGLAAAQDEKTAAGSRYDHPQRPDPRGNLLLDEGLVGGWCAAFRRRDYRLLDLALRLLFFVRLSFKHGEDGALCRFMKTVLRKRLGTIRTAECLHAYGPLWAKEAGHLDREIEKYRLGGLPELAERYERIRDGEAGA